MHHLSCPVACFALKAQAPNTLVVCRNASAAVLLLRPPICCYDHQLQCVRSMWSAALWPDGVAGNHSWHKHLLSLQCG